MKALTLAEIDRALARERNQRKKKPTKAASRKKGHHKTVRRKTAHHTAEHHKAVRRKTTKRTVAHHETRHHKIAKKAHHTKGPLRGAAKTKFLDRMKRGRERARRARARLG